MEARRGRGRGSAADGKRGKDGFKYFCSQMPHMSEELMAAIWKDCNGHAAIAVQRAISSDDQHFTEMYPVVTSQKPLSNFHEVKGKTVFCTFLFVCCMATQFAFWLICWVLGC